MIVIVHSIWIRFASKANLAYNEPNEPAYSCLTAIAGCANADGGSHSGRQQGQRPAVRHGSAPAGNNYGAPAGNSNGSPGASDALGQYGDNLASGTSLNEVRSGSGSGSGNEIEDLSNSIPGVPGQDYPILHEVPELAFTCEGRVAGGGISIVRSQRTSYNEATLILQRYPIMLLTICDLALP